MHVCTSHDKARKGTRAPGTGVTDSWVLRIELGSPARAVGALKRMAFVTYLPTA